MPALRSIKKSLKRFREYIPYGRWPAPKYTLEHEPHFLFVITPSHSGSTALAQILNSCPKATFLWRKGEGQWLVPGMCSSDRWNPHKQIRWESVRATWLKQVDYIQALVQDADLIIEKSPPNLVRMDQLIKTFPNCSLMAFNRDPYANISSRMHRRRDRPDKSKSIRLQQADQFAREWLTRSSWIRKWIEELDVLYLSYESFCADPAGCLQPLIDAVPTLETMDANKPIKVKSYAPQPVTNMNERQIKKLSAEEIAVISSILASDPELLDYFGYRPATGKRI